jgi:hypothetical protein
VQVVGEGAQRGGLEQRQEGGRAGAIGSEELAVPFFLVAADGCGIDKG